MNVIKLGLATVAVGLAMSAQPADAAVATWVRTQIAVDTCQSFSPGLANTFRNRVIGVENIGSSTASVACNYGVVNNNSGGGTTKNASGLFAYFYNSGTASATVSCTILTGLPVLLPQLSATRSIDVAAGANSSISFAPADLPGAPTDFGGYAVGMTCNLPTGMVMNFTGVSWQGENGI